MAGRYIPPHLRNKQASAPDAGAPNPGQTNLAATRRRSAPTLGNEGLTLREIHAYFWKDEDTPDSTHNTTLHSSSENPNGLAWVLLFAGANPKWDSDGVIFVKSNLDVLPTIQSSAGVLQKSGSGDRSVKPEDISAHPEDSLSHVRDAHTESDEVAGKTGKEDISTSSGLSSVTPAEGIPIDHPPIAVFSQPHRMRSGRCWRFVGWYKISHLELIAPHSEGLVRMLSKKWETVDKYGRVQQRRRDAKGWEESMAHKWAVIKMEKDVEAMQEKGEPKIERIEEDEEGGGVSLDGQGSVAKNVNEILAELRIKDQAKSALDSQRE